MIKKPSSDLHPDEFKQNKEEENITTIKPAELLNNQTNISSWVIGVGTFGCRAIDFLNKNFPDILKYAIDTDKSELDKLSIKNKILFGQRLTNSGKGCFGHIDIAKQCFKLHIDEFYPLIKQNANRKLFIITGLGGGVGSGVTPEIVRLANQFNCKPYVLAVSMFQYSSQIMSNSDNCIAELHSLECYTTHYNEDFIKKEFGDLPFKESTEKTYLLLKNKMDAILSETG